MSYQSSKVPGPRAPAFLRLLGVSLTAVFSLALAAPAQAQLQQVPAQQNGLPPLPTAQVQESNLPPGQPPAATRPVPDQLSLAKLLWTTMAAVDHANKSGNYSVLRDISSTAFQINNNPSALANAFANIRNSRIDLSSVLLVPPSYTTAPQQLQTDVFRVQGVFNIRPIAIAFDMYFQWERGEWRLFGINVAPLPMQESAG
jgi:hypothetical protein